MSRKFIEVTYLDKDKKARTERYSNLLKAVNQINEHFGEKVVGYYTVARKKFPFVHNGIHFNKMQIK
jgi:hypothetical protein